MDSRVKTRSRAWTVGTDDVLWGWKGLASSHKSQGGTPPGAEDTKRSIEKGKMHPRMWSTKVILPSGLTGKEAEVTDYSDTEEDEAIDIPRVG